MPEKKKEKKKSSQCCNELANKVEVIYEILSAHKMDLEEIEGKVEEMSLGVDKVKGRMGL
jgi:hypothetical protein